MTGLYRLILRRLRDASLVDWKGLLQATATGQIKVEPQPGEPTDSALPSIIHEMQEGADKLIAIITYPDRVLMSPLAYLAYDWMCRAGSLSVADLQTTWQLSDQEVEAVIQELAGIYFWTHTKDQLKPFPAEHPSDFFHGTGIVRATSGGQVTGNNPAHY